MEIRSRCGGSPRPADRHNRPIMHRPDDQPIDPDRQARIEQIRREIAAGTYDSPERLDAALDAFLQSADGQAPATSSGPPLRGPHNRE